MSKGNIKYYSTNGKAPEVTFREALLKGLAPDGGLYMPDSFPELTVKELESLSSKNYSETASLILSKFLGNEIDHLVLAGLCNDAYNFDIPLEKVSGRKYILRLDRGPTASFKDFAARMMSRLMQHFLAEDKRQLTILTATSGDTGSAVASAFHNLANIKVIILFPVNEVSEMQRKQMTTLDGNICAVAVNGKFDDCQNMVKQAFQDPQLSKLALSSANSINIGRLLPQSVYYFYAWSRLRSDIDEKVVFSVPSGNFGNLMGGIISEKMGLPVRKFIIATNENDEVPEFLRTGNYVPVAPSRNCISSAMNVGHPSNLARIISIYNGMMNPDGRIIKQPYIEQMRKDFFGVSITDEETRVVIKDVFRKYGIITEPHGAAAWKGIVEYSKTDEGCRIKNQLFISLETAHPAKFPDEIFSVTGSNPEIPLSLEGLKDKAESYSAINNDYIELCQLIIKKTGNK